MARAIDLPQLRSMLEQGAQLVEVLPAEEFTEVHLPGAINLPLKQLDAASAGVLDRRRPIAVYCYDDL